MRTNLCPPARPKSSTTRKTRVCSSRMKENNHCVASAGGHRTPFAGKIQPPAHPCESLTRANVSNSFPYPDYDFLNPPSFNSNTYENKTDQHPYQRRLPACSGIHPDCAQPTGPSRSTGAAGGSGRSRPPQPSREQAKSPDHFPRRGNVPGPGGRYRAIGIAQGLRACGRLCRSGQSRRCRRSAAVGHPENAQRPDPDGTESAPEVAPEFSRKAQT